jgi:hypothetical protein
MAYFLTPLIISILLIIIEINELENRNQQLMREIKDHKELMKMHQLNYEKEQNIYN